MADVQLNLIYNDNGASKAIDSIVSQLRNVESKQWKINLSGLDSGSISKIDQMVNRLQSLHTIISRPVPFASSFEKQLNAYDSISDKISDVNSALTIYKNTLSSLPSSSGYFKTVYDEIQRLEKELETLTALQRNAFSRANVMGESFSYAEIEQALKATENSIQQNRSTLLAQFISPITEETAGSTINSIETTQNAIRVLEEQAERLRSILSSMGVPQLKEDILNISQAMQGHAGIEEVIKIAQTNAHNTQQAFYENLFGSHAIFDEVADIVSNNARNARQAFYENLFNTHATSDEVSNIVSTNIRNARQSMYERLWKDLDESKAREEADRRAQSEQKLNQEFQQGVQRLREQEAAQERSAEIQKQRKQQAEEIAKLEAQITEDIQKQVDTLLAKEPKSGNEIWSEELSNTPYASLEERQARYEYFERWKKEQMYRELFDEADARDKMLKGQADADEKRARQIVVAQNSIAQGYHQAWRGAAQAVQGAIQTMQSAYNTFKSVVEAPLNLTGVSSLVSMLESMEGSLLLNQISSNIMTGFSEGVERYDILMSFPAVMENIGYSTDEATAAMDRLYQSVLGLPTSFGDIVQNTQFFTLVLDDLEKATDLAIAANNAFVASGADSQQISSGMRQLQYILEGTKLRSTQWYSLIRSMPLALREVGDALGYPDFNSFTADLMAGSIASEDLIDTLIDVGLNSEKLGGIIEVMKSRIEAALDNVTNAGKRMGDTLVKTLDEVLTREGGKGITENIKGVSDIVDHIAEVAAKWINDHGAEIQALIDKFFNIDWASVVPEFLQGLVNIANKALDNIGTWIQDIGGIIEKVRTTFNDFENSPILKAFLGGGNIISGIVNTIAGAANIYAGFRLVGTGNSILNSLGVSGGTTLAAKLGFSTTAFSALGSAIGTAFVASLPVWLTTIGLGIARSMDEENDEYFEKSKQDGSLDTMVSTLANDWKKAADKVRSGDTSYLYDAQAIADEIKYITRGQYDFGELTAENINDVYWQINRLRESPFEKRISGRYKESILRAELESIGESIPKDLYEAWDKVWEGYQNRLDEVQKRADRISDKLKELRDEADKWVDTTVEDMAKIYGGKDGKGGKFLSEQVKEAFGGLFRNTTNDFIMTQEDAGAAMTSVNDKIMEAIGNMPESERAKAYEAWADYLGNFDFTDTASLAQLQKMGEETGEQLVNTFLLPRDKADEVLNENNKTTKEMREGALTAAGAELDSEEEKILKEAGDNPVFSAIGQQLVDWADDMSETYLPLIQDSLGMFSNDVVRAIQEMVNRINERRFYINPRVVYNEQPGWVSPEGYHATGGWISKGTDTVPAMLTPGEYVQRRAAVEHFGRQFMERINNLDLRGALRSISMNYATPYATGGFVRNDNRNYRDNHATVNQIFKSANASTGFRRASRFVRALG